MIIDYSYNTVTPTNYRTLILSTHREMATLSKPVGYEYEFVDQVPEDYFCKLCKHVAREAGISSCCGEVMCKACVDVII